MTAPRNSPKVFQAPVAWPAESQYLKIGRSSKRFMKLMRLADELQCSWQSIAHEAIDLLLESRLAQISPPSDSTKFPKK